MGENVTYVDFVMFELCEFMGWITDGELYTKFPNLKGYQERIKNLPKLKEFYEDDTKCIKRPYNNKVAKLNN